MVRRQIQVRVLAKLSVEERVRREIALHIRDMNEIWTVVLGLLFMALVNSYLSHNARVPVSGVRRDVTLGEGYKEPFIVNGALTDFLHWTVDFFVDEYGDIGIMVLESPDSACATSRSRVIHMRLRDYVNDHMRSSTSLATVFPDDDGYQFLQEIGLRDAVVKAFSHLMPVYRCRWFPSGWGKRVAIPHSTTTRTTNLLCPCQGRKKRTLPPFERRCCSIGETRLVGICEFRHGGRTRPQDSEKQGALISVVLEEGDS